MDSRAALPENTVLSFRRGTTELVHLFDFDTLLPLSALSAAVSYSDKLSYTRGFAALELQTSDCRKIGKHTDVYGVGALLFYLLFHRVPDAFDCAPEAAFDFSASRLSGTVYPDQLPLHRFFHHTLASFYPDRYADMAPVIESLTALLPLADPAARFLSGTVLSRPESLFGRAEELQWLRDRLTAAPPVCCFVTGMGGIGKSTLVRASLTENEALFDTMLYVPYHHTLADTIADDFAVPIHTVRKDRSETVQAYFERKLGVLRTLTEGQKCVLVIDRFEDDGTENFSKLLCLRWTIVIITRQSALATGFPSLAVGRVRETAALLAIFEKQLGHPLSESEKCGAQKIIEQVDGHTLVLALIARQIASPLCGLSIEAAQLVARDGLSPLAAEKISYRKDSNRKQTSLRRIIAELFADNTLSASKRVLLQLFALFGTADIPLAPVCALPEGRVKADVAALVNEGWLALDCARLHLHPVVCEAVCSWPLTALLQKAADQTMIRLAETLLPPTQPTAVHRAQQTLYFPLAIRFLDGCRKNAALCASDCYRRLLYAVLRCTPFENGQYLREKSEEYIERTAQPDDGTLLTIYEGLLEVLYEHGARSPAACARMCGGSTPICAQATLMRA